VRPRVILLLAGLALSAASPAQELFPSPGARPVSLCETETECAPPRGIRLLGVLELPARTINGLRFAGLSDLAWDDDDGILYAVSDKGYLFGLHPGFRNGQLVDVALKSAAALVDARTRKPVKWRRSDAEGLDILNGRNGRPGDAELVVSFEGEPRIARYRPDGRFLADIPLSAPLSDILQYRYNKMLEAVCVHPREGTLTAPEEPLNGDRGTTRLYRSDGRSWRIPASRGGIVALECLPDGNVLVLERDFSSLTLRWTITLRRLRLPAGTAPDTLLAADTITVLDSHDGLRIDNFEGLTRHHGNRFFMVSDDNDVFVQRTLLVYFELLP
jgi:hypothetical protein